MDAAASRGKLYEVKLDKKTAGPVEIRLVTERAHNPQQAEELLELAGFEVAGAVRQWGTIAVQVQGNWQVVWGQMSHVRQVDEFAGPLPRPLEDREPFTAGVLKNAKEPDIAQAFVASLTAPEAAAVWTELGFAAGPASH